MIDALVIRFLIISAAISVFVSVILLVKKLCKKHLSLRVQYNIWFLLLIMLALPFLPVKSDGFSGLWHWFLQLGSSRSTAGNTAINAGTAATASTAANWMQDFTVSVKHETPAMLNYLLCLIWGTGILIMAILTLRSQLRIRQVIKSALPVQNPQVKIIYNECRGTIGISKNIRLYSSAFIQSPISVGLLKPCIVIPIHMITGSQDKDIRFILLHELQHYKHRDVTVNYLMCLARIIYWFHPLVWLALKEMRNDREVACDAAVLRTIDENSYADYGYTLLNFAEKLSHSSFSSAAGMGGTKKQIKKRIIHIASFHPESKWLKLKSCLIFTMALSIVIGSAPLLALGTSAGNEYHFNNTNVEYEDLGSYFQGYDGSFVLYDQNADYWSIYNKDASSKRVSPDSTYKIYSALFGLESGSINPEDSSIAWDQTEYPFESWNQNHDLDSAMSNSVNWYFQAVDQKTGLPALQNYIHEVGYGNQDLSGGISRYWMESSLKISPIEQVEQLSAMYRNDLQFKANNIQAVKNALHLSDSFGTSLYGKTGTGDVEGKNVNGWFIGFLEKDGNTFFFATNIQGADFANGSMASKISLEILQAKNLYIGK